MPIFDLVNLFSSIVFRKMIASFLLVLFIFIHAEKVFHTHQPGAAHSQQKGIALKPVSTTCAICDFQLAKDSELPILSSTGIPYSFLLKEYPGIFTFYQFLPATAIANRGPPAC